MKCSKWTRGGGTRAASLTQGLAGLFDAGLDAIRVSINSAVKDLYEG